MTILGLGSEVLAVFAVNALLEGTLGVGLALAGVVHSVLLVTLAGGTLELDVLGVALVLWGRLGLGVLLLFLWLILGLVLRLLLGLVILGLLLWLVLRFFLGLVLRLFLRLVLGLFFLGSLLLGRLLLFRLLSFRLLGVLLVGTVSAVVTAVGRLRPEVPAGWDGDSDCAYEPAENCD